MDFARRAFVSVLAIAVNAWCQSKRNRLTEEDEWKDAYELARRGVSTQRPKDGLVPNAETALRIAEAIARAAFGAETVLQEQPFRVRLRGNVWTVMGTMNPTLGSGGVAIIQVAKSDGRVIFATHTQ
jgi:hypothetical protein